MGPPSEQAPRGRGHCNAMAVTCLVQACSWRGEAGNMAKSRIFHRLAVAGLLVTIPLLSGCQFALLGLGVMTATKSDDSNGFIPPQQAANSPPQASFTVVSPG